MLPFQTENGSQGGFPESVYHLLIASCKRNFVVCPSCEEIIGNYPFANGLNGLNALAHLWKLQSS
jgi:hypothetical protein